MTTVMTTRRRRRSVMRAAELELPELSEVELRRVLNKAQRTFDEVELCITCNLRPQRVLGAIRTVGTGDALAQRGRVRGSAEPRLSALVVARLGAPWWVWHFGGPALTHKLNANRDANPITARWGSRPRRLLDRGDVVASTSGQQPGLS